MSLRTVNGDLTKLISLNGIEQSNGAQYLSSIQDSYRFQVLYDKVLKFLMYYLDFYNEYDTEGLILASQEGDYLNMLVNIQIDNLYNNDTITTLEDYTYNVDLFKTYKDSLLKVINGLNAAIAQSIKNNELKQENESLLEYKNILDSTDTNAIRDYILKRNQDLNLFSDNEMLDLDFELKPWFLEYLKEYGPPPDGFFEATKLSEIVINLINNGTININEFVLDRLN